MGRADCGAVVRAAGGLGGFVSCRALCRVWAGACGGWAVFWRAGCCCGGGGSGGDPPRTARAEGSGTSGGGLSGVCGAGRLWSALSGGDRGCRALWLPDHAGGSTAFHRPAPLGGHGAGCGHLGAGLAAALGGAGSGLPRFLCRGGVVFFQTRRGDLWRGLCCSGMDEPSGGGGERLAYTAADDGCLGLSRNYTGAADLGDRVCGLCGGPSKRRLVRRALGGADHAMDDIRAMLFMDLCRWALA